MNKEELLGQINEWHETEGHKKIIDTIEALPREEWDYELIGLLARAYNNLAMFDETTPEEEQPRLLEKAVSLLESVREEGQEDALWHYRLGYSLYYLCREAEALTCFQRSAELNPDDEDSRFYISECEKILAAEATVYSEEEMEAVEGYISKRFGEFETVFHEIYSPDIHVDICLIPPDGERNYYTLVTMGMGAHRMNVPEELAEYRLERAELAICLPPDWKLDEESLKDDDQYWPIRLLKSTARLPVQCDTWLGWGHTVQMDEGETYAQATALCGCILIEPQRSESEDDICTLPDGEPVNFYQLIPLYQDEIAYKLEHGAKALLEKLGGTVSYVIEPNRPSALHTDWRTQTWTELQ